MRARFVTPLSETLDGSNVFKEERMRESMIRSLEKRLKSYSGFLATIDPPDLGTKLDVPKGNSVAKHLWCVIGARESYARALASGE
ncbi:MAG: hypothetical protein EA417_12670 [Gammaproteobacteria bacterium]|nr:MAG: hypothetical protein EA417_12670 [Gammaproteobacteria bacterium]